MLYWIGVTAAFLLGWFVHDPIVNAMARLRGKTRVIAFRGPRNRKDGAPDAS